MISTPHPIDPSRVLPEPSEHGTFAPRFCASGWGFVGVVVRVVDWSDRVSK
jgi:hypothetical protein